MRKESQRNRDGKVPLLRLQDSSQGKATNSEKAFNRLGGLMILISTSRKPSQNTRRLARQISMALPHSKYITRGKKSVDSLCSEAAREGYSKVALIFESHGNPYKLSFIKNSGDEWDWLLDELKIKSFKIENKIRKQFNSIIIDKKLKDIFMPGDEESDNHMEIKNNKLIIKSDNDIMLEIKID